MNLELSTQNKYLQKVVAIKKKLNEYDDESFIRKMYEHFQTIRNPQNGIISNFPWCCFLALKWKLTEPTKIHVKVMTKNDFIKIINKIYNLQTDAMEFLDRSKVLLSIRRMLINQMLYQAPMKAELDSLARQYHWYCNYEGGYFEKSFNTICQITLEDYYKISAYFEIVSCIDDGKESTFIPDKVYLIHLVPYFSPEIIKSYLKLTSVRLSELRDFMAKYKNPHDKDNEYYQDTPMLNKPMILVDDGIVILSKHILRASLTSLVPYLLKNEYAEDYKEKFGRVMERYVKGMLEELPAKLTYEKEILSSYKKNGITGKVVDFILNEDSANVYIDSKAIEPEKTVKSSNFASHIKGRLKNSFIKGVLQGQECARLFNEINAVKKNKKDSLIIIVHKDHYIPTGKMIEEVLDPTIFSLIEKRYGSLAINKERIYYMTINEFERLIEVCKEQKISITSVIDACSENDSNSRTKKFNVMMHIHTLSTDGIPDRKVISEYREKLFDELIESMGKSNKHWDGKINDYLLIKKFVSS